MIMSNRRERMSVSMRADHREMLDEMVANNPYIESRSRMIELLIRNAYDDSKTMVSHG